MAAGDLGLRATVDLLTVEPLIAQEADGRLLPRLAESWRWESDGLQLRITLRDGVTFHDGTLLSSSVAAALLDAFISVPARHALYPALADVTAVRAEPPRDVVLDLSRRSSFLPGDLSFPLRSPDGSVGTGPFRVVENSPLRATLERFELFHQGVPGIERIEIEAFESLRPAWASLLRGELDMVYDVPPEAVDLLQSEDVSILRHARPYQYLIAFNSAREPFVAPAVRRALNLAVDRDIIVRDVLRGNGRPSSGPIGPQFWAYDESIPPFSFDPQLASELLAEAGLTPGRATASDNPAARLRFTCLLPEGFSILENLALEVQRDLYDIGVDMQVEVVSVNDYNLRIRDGSFEAVLIDASSGPGLGRGYEVFWRPARSFQGINAFGYDNVEAERIFEDLRASLESDAAVRTATRRLQSLFLDDPPALFLAWNERARAVRSSFDVVTEAGRDPIADLWRWSPSPP